VNARSPHRRGPARDGDAADGGGSRPGFVRVLTDLTLVFLLCAAVAGLHAASGLSSIATYDKADGPVSIGSPGRDAGRGSERDQPGDRRGGRPQDRPENRPVDQTGDPDPATPPVGEGDEQIEDPTPRTPTSANGDSPSDLMSMPLDCGMQVEPEIGLETGAALWRCAFEEGVLVHFLDARRREDFDAGRVMGAIWMPARRIDELGGLSTLDQVGVFPEDPIVIYCTGGDCDASHNTAARLQQAGFTNLIIMTAGYDDWRAAGLPTEGG